MIKRTNNKGFTVLELMIATGAFSVILLVVLASLLAIGRLYYKGSTESRVQEIVRSTVDNITQTIQFSGEAVEYRDDSGTTRYCIGDIKYIFREGFQLADSPAPASSVQSEYVLLVLQDPSCSPSPAFGSGLQELLGEDMHLVEFEITESNGLVDVNLTIAYGGDASIDGDLEEIFDYNDANANNRRDAGEELIRCKTNAPGAEFCALSGLSSTVFRKIQ